MTEASSPLATTLPSLRPAIPRDDDPSALIEAHYRQLWETRRHAMPGANAALCVEAFGFQRLDGDWLGVVIAPWSLDLVLMSGGGQWWGDIPNGERRYLNLPCGTLQFLASDDPGLGPYQHCPLIETVTGLPDMRAARYVAADAIRTVFPVPGRSPEVESQGELGDASEVSRRGFFRRLAGKRS